MKHPTDTALRQAQCAAFRNRLLALNLRINAFARLTGNDVRTVYTWTMRSASCTPPSRSALRWLDLFESHPPTLKRLHAKYPPRKRHA